MPIYFVRSRSNQFGHHGKRALHTIPFPNDQVKAFEKDSILLETNRLCKLVGAGNWAGDVSSRRKTK